VGERIYVVSNLSGRLSLYAMAYTGNVPEPLLPPQIALQNPALIGGQSFYVFPALGQILVMIDHDGDENYQPMLVPLDGGLPAPAFGDRFARHRVYLLHAEQESATAYLVAESRDVQVYEAYKGELATGALTKRGESCWGGFIDGVSADETPVVMIRP
jgi:hypothetical protein